MRIWQSYYENAKDKHQAVRDVIEWDDPEEILRKSGYEGRGRSENSRRCLRLRVELEDAQLLVAAAGLRDARGPRDGLFARGQFEHGEAAV